MYGMQEMGLTVSLLQLLKILEYLVLSRKTRDGDSVGCVSLPTPRSPEIKITDQLLIEMVGRVGIEPTTN